MPDTPMASAMPHVEGVRHRDVEVLGSRTHLAVAGDPAAPPVVLVHGFPQHWYAWRHVLADLAVDHLVVAIDLPGFGWSEPSRHGYSTLARTRHVLAVMDELGIGRADVVGHDWGAWCAFRLAIETPERVRHLVSVCELHPWPLQRRLVPRLWRMWVTAMFEAPVIGVAVQRQERITAWFLRRDAARPEVWTDELLATYTRPAAQPATARAGRRMHGAFIARDIPRLVTRRGHPSRFATPTLMVAGSVDAYIPPALVDAPRKLRHHISTQTVTGGHFLLDENPDQLTAMIRSHLQGVSPPAGVNRS